MSPATEPLPADLVLEGGGVKGIALAGALSELLATDERLFATGQQAARTFLARWDWSAYLRDCRGVR